jgi:hypothetical protein
VSVTTSMPSRSDLTTSHRRRSWAGTGAAGFRPSMLAAMDSVESRPVDLKRTAIVINRMDKDILSPSSPARWRGELLIVADIVGTVKQV